MQRPKSSGSHSLIGRLIVVFLAFSTLLILTIIVTSVYFISSLNGESESMYERIRANGYPANYEELSAWDSAPESENAAPLIQSVSLFLEDDDDLKERLEEFWEDTPYHDPEEVWSKEKAEAAGVLLEDMVHIVASIEFAAEKSLCAFEPPQADDIYEDGYVESALYDVQKVICIMAHRHLALGDVDASIETIELGVKIARLMEDSPNVSAQYYRLYLQQSLRNFTMHLISNVVLDTAALDRLHEAFTPIDSRFALIRAVAGDRAWAFFAIEEFYSGNAALGSGITEEDRRQFEQVPASMREFFIEWERRAIDDLTGPFLADLPETWPEILDAANVASLDRISDFSLIAAPLSNDIEDIAISMARSEADFSTTLTAIAVECYSRKHNEYPDSLGQLVPEYLEEIPIDPFDGEPLRYRQTDDGYEVYSVFTNREDDDGVDYYLDDAEYESDWVFRVVFTKRRADSSK